MPKFLVIRFSSIGDIVLTTPVIRILKQQVKGAEIHYLTKLSSKTILQYNPYIDFLWTFDKSLDEILPNLKAEGFDYIIDLHNNLRSLKVKSALGKKAFTFNKLNIEKWLLVNLKINRLPTVHIVDRYLKTLSEFKVFNDLAGLDYFIGDENKITQNDLPDFCKDGFIAIVIGAKHSTKKMPSKKIIELATNLNYPVVLLGGPEDENDGNEIEKQVGNLIFNACGKFKLNQSASIIQQSKVVITHDTGLMHIAAAFNKPIISIWGNTVPEFGMSPYLPQAPANSIIFEVKNLNCRPCSKIGFDNCPKKHFKCMQDQDIHSIVKNAKQFLQ